MLTTAIYEDLLTDTENLISYHNMDLQVHQQEQQTS